MNYTTWIYIGIVGGVISIGVAIYLYFWVMRQNRGSEKAQEVSSWIRSGANTYLRRLYTALAILAVIIGVIIALILALTSKISARRASSLIRKTAYKWQFRLWLGHSAQLWLAIWACVLQWKPMYVRLPRQSKAWIAPLEFPFMPARCWA